jgi:glutathione S-transferase
MIILHYEPGAASFAPHALLNEIGLPFELRRIDSKAREHKTPEYLALNPNGLIPVLQDGKTVLFETAAICMHLADRFPAAQLAPAIGRPERPHFYKWMVWFTNTMQAHLIHYFYPERMVDDGNAEGAAQLEAHAQARVVQCLAMLDTELARHGGPWLLGQTYSAADAMGFMLCRWTRHFKSQRARDHRHVLPWLQRVYARPAVQQTVSRESLAEPF